jgi:hypothetical protein
LTGESRELASFGTSYTITLLHSCVVRGSGSSTDDNPVCGWRRVTADRTTLLLNTTPFRCFLRIMDGSIDGQRAARPDTARHYAGTVDFRAGPCRTTGRGGGPGTTIMPLVPCWPGPRHGKARWPMKPDEASSRAPTRRRGSGGRCPPDVAPAAPPRRRRRKGRDSR